MKTIPDIIEICSFPAGVNPLYWYPSTFFGLVMGALAIEMIYEMRY